MSFFRWSWSHICVPAESVSSGEKRWLATGVKSSFGFQMKFDTKRERIGGGSSGRGQYGNGQSCKHLLATGKRTGRMPFSFTWGFKSLEMHAKLHDLIFFSKTLTFRQ